MELNHDDRAAELAVEAIHSPTDDEGVKLRNAGLGFRGCFALFRGLGVQGPRV